MVERYSRGRVAFVVFNYIFLALMAVVCLLPLIHVLAVSFSSSHAAAAGYVKLWPVDFTLRSYEFVSGKKEFLDSMLITLERVGIGVSLNMLLTVLVAYPLSKETTAFRSRTLYAWIFVFTILFSGGLIPLYMMVKDTMILDSIWLSYCPGRFPSSTSF